MSSNSIVHDPSGYRYWWEIVGRLAESLPAASTTIVTTSGATFFMSYIVRIVVVPILRVAITEESK